MDALIAQLQRQFRDYTISLYRQRFLDDQFTELKKLQDECSPDFVAEVVTLFFEDCEKLISNMASAFKRSTNLCFDEKLFLHSLYKFQDNKNHIAEVVAANDIQCDDLASICHADTMCLSNHIEEIVVSAISYHLIHTKEPEYRNGKLVISSKSLSHGLSIFQEGGNRSFEDSLKLDTNTDSKRKEGEVCSKSESKSGPEIDCKIDCSIESFC